jgi:hypothetical protein
MPLGYSESVGSRDELYESPLSARNSLDGLDDGEWRRVIAHRHERQQQRSQLIESLSEGRWDDGTARHHSPRRETAMEREARMARRGPRRRTSPVRRDRSPVAATRTQLVDQTGARYSYLDGHEHQRHRRRAEPMSQYYRRAGALRVASPTRNWNASAQTREGYVSPRRDSRHAVVDRVQAGNTRSLYTYDYSLADDFEVRAWWYHCTVRH